VCLWHGMAFRGMDAKLGISGTGIIDGRLSIADIRMVCLLIWPSKDLTNLLLKMNTDDHKIKFHSLKPPRCVVSFVYNSYQSSTKAIWPRIRTS
jgi:hypothetical protein